MTAEVPWTVEETQTAAAVQYYLDELGGIPRRAPAGPIVRALLDRAIRRLQLLGATLLHPSYRRLAHTPFQQFGTHPAGRWQVHKTFRQQAEADDANRTDHS